MTLYSISSILALSCLISPALAGQLLPRQTSLSNSSSTTVSSAPAITSSSVPPCCWLVGAFQGVKVNTWYSVATQYTATVVTTFIRLNGTIKPANSTTIYLPADEIITEYGAWGQGAVNIGSISSTTIPEVPITLVPDDLMEDYAATDMLPGNSTVYTTMITNLADSFILDHATSLGAVVGSSTANTPTMSIVITSPTPWAIYYMAVVTTYDPSPASTYNPSTCGTPTQVPYVTYAGNAWGTVNKTVTMPINYTIADLWDLDIFDWQYRVVTTLPAPPPNNEGGITIDLPPGASSSMVADPYIMSAYPWITNCFTAGGTGEPTVHVPVTQLTSDSSVTVGDMAPSSPSPQSSVASTSTPTTEQAVSATTAASPTDQTVTALTTTPPAAQAVSTISTSPTDQSVKGITTPIPSPASSQSLTTEPGQVTTPAGTPSQAATSIIGNTITAQPLGTSAAIVGSTTIVVGSVITQDGQTISLASQTSGVAVVINGITTQALASNGAQISVGNAIVIDSSTLSVGGPALVAGGSTISLVSQSTGIAVVVDGTTSPLNANTQQTLTALQTSAGQSYSIGTAAVVIGSSTLSVGGPALITGGSTISLASQSTGIAIVVDGTTSPLHATQTVTALGQATALQTLAGQSYSVGSAAIVIGSNTLSVGGPALVTGGSTISLASQSMGLAIVVDGTTSALNQQVVTAFGQVFTANLVSAGAVVNGVTVPSGSSVVINGDTIAISGTNLVAASGSSTTTKGLGGAIMSGLGQGGTASVSTQPKTGMAVEAYTVRLWPCIIFAILFYLSCLVQ